MKYNRNNFFSYINKILAIGLLSILLISNVSAKIYILSSPLSSQEMKILDGIKHALDSCPCECTRNSTNFIETIDDVPPVKNDEEKSTILVIGKQGLEILEKNIHRLNHVKCYIVLDEDTKIAEHFWKHIDLIIMPDKLKEAPLITHYITQHKDSSVKVNWLKALPSITHAKNNEATSSEITPNEAFIDILKQA